jgi:hypothetical protein
MSIVIPSWCLIELLNDERLVEMRKDKQKQAEEERKPVEESEEGPPGLTREDFEATLRQVTRRVDEPKKGND